MWPFGSSKMAASEPLRSLSAEAERWVGEWRRCLGDGIDLAVLQQVWHLMETYLRQRSANQDLKTLLRAAQGTEVESKDAAVTFLLYLQSRGWLRAELQPPASKPAGPPPVREGSSSPDGPGVKGEPVQPPVTSSFEDEKRRWLEAAPLDGERLSELRKCLLLASNSHPLKDQVRDLQAVLRVYFRLDWQAAGDILLALAYRAGELLCGLIQRQGQVEPERLMASGCELLNAHPQFRTQYECRAVPMRAGYDSTIHAPPEGNPTGGNTVVPSSFYVVSRRTSQTCRRARVQWA